MLADILALNDNLVNFDFSKAIISKTNLVLVAGKAGVGKSTFAKYGIEWATTIRPNGYYYVDAFARPIKDMAREYFYWDGKKNSKGRKLLQNLGSTGREYDKDFWVRQTCDSILAMPPDIVFIDDWRFPNEYDYFLKHEDYFNIKKVYIHSPEREILKGTLEYNDISETSLPNFRGNFYYNSVVLNVHDLDYLERISKDLIENIFYENRGY